MNALSINLNVVNPLTHRPGIYAIRNLVTGKVYVGSAQNIRRRHGEHQRMLRRGAHENPLLQKAWNKHGTDALAFKVMLICDQNDLIFFEQRALDCYARNLGWRNLYNQSRIA